MQNRARYTRAPKKPSPLLLLLPVLIILVLVASIVAVLLNGGTPEVDASVAETPTPVPTASPAPETRLLAAPRSEAVDMPVLTTAAALPAGTVSERLGVLRRYFADGTYWNHFGQDATEMSDLEMAMSTTTIPCAHEENAYEFCNIYLGETGTLFPEYDYDTQCLAFASLVSDLLFGTDAPLSVFYEFEDLRVGDHIRLIGAEHSMIVISINAEGDAVRLLDVNADYENCKIEWGRELTYSALLDTGSSYEFITRYE